MQACTYHEDLNRLTVSLAYSSTDQLKVRSTGMCRPTISGHGVPYCEPEAVAWRTWEDIELEHSLTVRTLLR